MFRTPIPNNLVHKPADVEANAKLFDAFVDLVKSTSDIEPEIAASNLLERIRHRVSEEGEVKLPFGLVVKRDNEF